MQFPGIFFLFYFLPAILLIYFACAFSRKLQNLWLLLAGVAFYAWGEPRHAVFLAASIVVNWFLGGLAGHLRTASKKAARIAVALAVCFNLGALFLYKYLGAALEGANLILGTRFYSAGAGAPLGISIFTLMAISYVVDAYRGRAKPAEWPTGAGLYMVLLPLAIAGPVIRYADLARQFPERRATWGRFADGCARFAMGTAKTVLIAQPMRAVADNVFLLSDSGSSVVVVPAMLAWVGVAAFGLQIYFQLSGCADLAVGVGGMLGLELPENFAHPYASRSMNEFWRRWQMTLIAWCKRYLPYPIGDLESQEVEKQMAGRHYFRGMLVAWLLIGLWHGPSLTMALWGLWNFLFLLLENASLFPQRAIPRALGHAYLLLAVGLGWVLFRSSSVSNYTLYMSNLLGLNANGYWSDLAAVILRENWLFFLLGALFSTPVAQRLAAIPRRVGAEAVFAAGQAFLLLAVYAVSVVYLVKSCYDASFPL